MTRSRVVRLAGALVLALGLATPTLPAAASDLAATSSVDAPRVSAGMAQALGRDLGLTADQVRTRLAQEERARGVETVARKVLGSAYAGSWFDERSGELVVAAVGATAPALDVKVVPAVHTLADLDSAKAGLDRLAGKAAPAAVNGWYVDVRTNTVVVTVNRTELDHAARAFVDRAKATHGSVRVVEEDHSPRPLADVVGGWPYWINYAGRCSIGFAVHGGFVTAGHCGRPGNTASDGNGAVLGSFAGSYFPGYDYAWVRTNAGVNLWGYMEGYDGYWYYVRGSAQVPVGSGICRSGSTTGMWCGSIVARGQTVNYPQGVVYNLTRTTVCAEPGDSGGSWLSSNQAQGVTSGGSGNCSSGGVTFYQEVNPILSAYGLSLVLS
ncbi:S1 family peptidase [Saccharothrix hoggarensis]|uniref:S1 family peptidase n=1 Tax=Saccharothrix hoggarensis TaxID=913853 RepID=A0ABW3QQ07_9PSEU